MREHERADGCNRDVREQRRPNGKQLQLARHPAPNTLHLPRRDEDEVSGPDRKLLACHHPNTGSATRHTTDQHATQIMMGRGQSPTPDAHGACSAHHKPDLLDALRCILIRSPAALSSWWRWIAKHAQHATPNKKVGSRKAQLLGLQTPKVAAKIMHKRWRCRLQGGAC